MPLTTTQQTEAYRFFAIAFNAAPGVEYMNQIAAAYEGGASTKQIVNEFVKKSVFTNSYPNFLTNEQFASRLIDNVVGAAATDAAKTEAKADVVAALAGGSSRGDVIFQIFTNLSQLTDDATWGNMAAKMANQVAVSRYYTETLLRSSTDLATLQAVIAGVDQSTVVTIAALEARLNPPASQTFTLTTGVDAFTGGAGNDTFNATFTTLTALDSLNGGDGTDTLSITDATGGNKLPTNVDIKSIETINLVSAGDVGATGAGAMDVSALTGVTTLNVTRSYGDTFVKVGTGQALNVSGGADGKAVTVTASTTSPVSVTALGTVGVTGGSSVGVTSKGGATVTNAKGAVSVTDSTGAVTVTGAGSTTQTIASKGGFTLSGATGAVSVTDSALAANSTVDGGTSNTVTATVSLASASPTLTIGGTTAPTGAVSVTANIAGNKAANSAAGAISVKGGTTVEVNQVTTQAIATPSTTAGATTTNFTAIQGAVTVTGTATTTAVTVNQTAAVAKVDSITAKAGVQEVSTATFAALADGANTSLGGLTFTNKSGASMTAAQVAAAFANLTAGDTQGNSTLGTYSGTFSADFTTGAASSSKVSATAVTAAASGAVSAAGTLAGTVVATQGVAAVKAQTGVGGIVSGVVTISDVNYNVAGKADTIASVTLNGYGSGSTVSSDALTSLSLANAANAAVTVNNNTATTLGLTLNNVTATTPGVGSTLTIDGGTAGTYKTLNITTSSKGSAVAVTAAGVTALTVAGDASVNLTGSTLTALKTATVSGTAGVTAGTAFAGASVTSVNASGTSGAMSASIDGSKATYSGGTGADTITLTSTTVSKAISLGAGDDSLSLASGTTSLAETVNGGDGTDTLVMAAADAATATLTNVFMGRVASFEKLSLGQVAGGATNSVDLSNINGISHVVSAGGAAGGLVFLYTSITGGTVLGGFQTLPAGSQFTLLGLTLTVSAEITGTQAVQALTGVTVAGATVSGTLNAGVTLTANGGNTAITVGGTTVSDFQSYTGPAGALTLTKMANAGTLELTAAAGTTTVTMTDATGTADSFNIITKNGSDTNFGTVSVAGVESVNITATDTTATTINTHTLTVSGSAAKSIVASGNAKLTLTSAGTALTSVDASAMSGTFTFSSAVTSVNIKGGSGADALTASGIGAAIDGGAGNDTIVVTGDYAVITGGAGNDTFDVSDKTSNVNAYNTIADFTVGDSIKFAAGASLFKATRVSLPSDTAVFQDFANAAIASSTDGQISWFQFGGNTYIVQNATGGSADQFTNNVDIIVKLSGLIDLSSGTFSTSALTLQITGG